MIRYHFKKGLTNLPIALDNLKKVLYDDRVKELEIRSVKCYQYIGNNKWQPLNYTSFSILETYKTNILEKFKENSVLI